MASVVVIDDDLAMDLLSDSLRYRGHEAYRIPSADIALREIDKIVSADLVVLDIIMPWPEERTMSGLSGASTAGMEIFREIRKQSRDIPIIAYSASQDTAVIDTIGDDPHSAFISKWESHTLRQLVKRINQTLGMPNEFSILKPFIIHGHNETAKLALKNYLQNTLKLPEPIILHEQPNLGRTIIEKFEDYAAFSSLIFILLTPDDIVANGEETDDVKRMARQNVIFEMGYFLGMVGRRSGRVLLLYQGPLELPSDLSGIVYIDISNGIEAVGEKIRREVENVKI